MTQSIELTWPQVTCIRDALNRIANGVEKIAEQRNAPKDFEKGIKHELYAEPRNKDFLMPSDKINMKAALDFLHIVHEQHKNADGIYLCANCPLCDQAICAYSALVTMCNAAGINTKTFFKGLTSHD